MRVVIAAAAALALLSGSAYAEDKSLVDTAMNGVSPGTPEGRELSAKLLAYSIACPVKPPQWMVEVSINIMLENGGVEGAKIYTRKVDAEIKAAGREKWCAGVLNMLQRIEEAASGPR
jgi:hypothetical protein